MHNKSHEHSHPHPQTFVSGGQCHLRQQGAHYHVELLHEADHIDPKLPHAFTPKEQRALGWIIYRNREKLQKVSERGPMLLLIPDVDPDISGYDQSERQLGTDAVALLDKIYQLAPMDPHARQYINFFRQLNSFPSHQDKLTVIGQQTLFNHQSVMKPQQLVSILESFHCKPGVLKSNLFFMTIEHVRLLEQLFDNFYHAVQRQAKGIANHTTCAKFKFDSFPRMVKAAPSGIKDALLPLLDEISTLLPTDCIIFNEKKKQSKGGWRVWKTNQNNIYIGTLYCQASNIISGAKAIEAMEMACNASGFKAKRAFHKELNAPALQFAFEPKHLQGSIQQIKKILADSLDLYKFKTNNSSLVKK